VRRREGGKRKSRHQAGNLAVLPSRHDSSHHVGTTWPRDGKVITSSLSTIDEAAIRVFPLIQKKNK
jgi:hypothetical protein